VALPPRASMSSTSSGSVVITSSGCRRSARPLVLVEPP
jgi:hypothetical protein